MFQFVATVLLASCSYLCVCKSPRLYTVTFDQGRLINGSFVDGYYKATEARVGKFNRTTYVWNMGIEYLVDFDNTYSAQVDAYYSRFNNNQYTKSPFRIPKMGFCDFWQKFYADSGVMERIKNYSNFPQYGNEPACPMRKGKYWIKDWSFDAEWLPPYVPAGVYKAFLMIANKDGNIIEYFELVAKVEQKLL